MDIDGSFTSTCKSGFTGDGLNYCQSNYCVENKQSFSIINFMLRVQTSMNVMLLIPVTTVLFVWTVTVHSHALVILDSQEMDSIVKVDLL